MKILAVNGSYRGGSGFTGFCIDKLFNGASAAGAECEVINLADMKINSCTGCQTCHTKKHYLKCVYEDKDDVQLIFNKIREADLIIYATPVYIFAMSGLLKRFLDRINSTGDSSKRTLSRQGLFFHHIDQSLCSKPFVLLVCCDNMEDETSRNVREYFRTFASFMDARQVGTIIRKSGKVMGHGKSPERERAFPKVAKVYQALNDAGRELATIGRITVGTQRRANVSIMPLPLIVEFLLHFRFFKKKMFPVIMKKSREFTEFRRDEAI